MRHMVTIEDFEGKRHEVVIASGFDQAGVRKELTMWGNIDFSAAGYRVSYVDASGEEQRENCATLQEAVTIYNGR